MSSQGRIDRARSKLAEKGCDVVVANEVGRPGIGFGADENAVTLVFADGRAEDLPPARKDRLARTIWDRLRHEIAAGSPSASQPNHAKESVRRRASRAKGKNA